jgi:adenylate kinase
LSQWTVFVGGIHGVGKTTVSRALAELLSASHVTAGWLIRETAGSETVTVGIDNKAVPDVNANQALLLQGLTMYRRRVSGPIVLDGHFSLLEPSGSVVAIPLAIYLALAPIAVVLVEADSQVVGKVIEASGRHLVDASIRASESADKNANEALKTSQTLARATAALVVATIVLAGATVGLVWYTRDLVVAQRDVIRLDLEQHRQASPSPAKVDQPPPVR